ncbi:MAG: DUF6036 family nucleotidyltransferase [Burkholderiales bacterium]
MQKLPNPAVGTNFLEAFKTMVGRIEASIKASGNKQLTLPVRMFIAGGAAAHFYTARRMTDDVDATFSHRMLLPEDLEVAYRDIDGKARLLYFDRQYNDTFGLLHEDAYRDSTLLKVTGIDPKVVEVRLLSPVDLAVSKLARFAEHDREDIQALAEEGLLNSKDLKRRAGEALKHYIGNPGPVKTSITLACRLIDQNRP